MYVGFKSCHIFNSMFAIINLGTFCVQEVSYTK